MSYDLVFQTQDDSCVLEVPDDRVLQSLKRLDEEAAHALFAVCELPEELLKDMDEPHVQTSRDALLSATERLLGKLGSRGTVQIEIVGFATQFAGGITPVQDGSTGFFQIAGSDQWYKLDASRSGKCRLNTYERPEGGMQLVGSRELPPGTVIQPSSYSTSYIVGAREHRVPIGRDLRRLRDFFVKVKDERLRIVSIV